MIGRIVRRELRDFLRDGRFVASATVILLLLATALVAGVLEVRQLRAERSAAQATTYEQWLGQGPRNAHSGAHYGLYAYKPTSGLAFLDPGIDRFAGTSVFLEAHRRNELLLRPAQDAADIARFAQLSAAFLLQVLVPLWLLLLAHGIITADRDTGTLRYVASFPVSTRTVGVAKALAATMAAASLLVPAVALGAVTLVATSADIPATALASRAAILAVIYLAFGLAMLAAGLAVAAWLRSSRVALVVVIGFWIASCIALPRGAIDMARTRYPLPPALEFKYGINQRLLEAEHDRRAELEHRVLREHDVERVDDLPFNFDGLDMQDSEELGDRVFDDAYADLYRRLDAQDAWQQHLAWATPLLAVRALSMAMAGTDSFHHRHFADAAERYRREMVKTMNMAVTRNEGSVNPGYVGTQSLNRMVDREVWETVPPFAYEAPPLASVLERSQSSSLVLGVWVAAACLVLAWRLQRFSVDPA